jgi:hypothetical protein
MCVDRFYGFCFLTVLVFYPLTYYATYIFPKYRHPIEPLMMLLAAFAMVQGTRVFRRSLES